MEVIEMMNPDEKSEHIMGQSQDTTKASNTLVTGASDNPYGILRTVLN